jgi:hypothetical protein
MPLPTPEEIAANQAKLRRPWGERVILALPGTRCQIGGELLPKDSVAYRQVAASAGGPLDLGNPLRLVEWNYRCPRHARQPAE